MVRLLAVLVALIATAGGAAAEPPLQIEFVVSPSGSDTAPGTGDRPFRTLARAQEAVRDALLQDADVVVTLRPGTHRLDAPLRLDARDAPLPGHTVVWQGHDAVVSGGTRIQGWRRGTDGIWQARVPHGLVFRQLWVDGVRAQRARGSGDGFTPAADGWQADTRLTRWDNPADVELVSNEAFKQYRGRVASVRGRDVHMVQPFQTGTQVELPPQEVTWVENALELLDQPGEWYLDRRTDMLHYRPRTGESLLTADVEAPTVDSLVEIEGTREEPVSGIQFHGIQFANAGWLGSNTPSGFVPVQANWYMTEPPFAQEEAQPIPGAVNAVYVSSLVFFECRFVQLGGSGLNLGTGTRSTMVVANVFSDISGNGINLGDIVDHPDDESMVTADHYIANNVIRDVAKEYQGGVGIWAGYVRGMVIERNVLSDLPYTAISIGWGWGAPDDPLNPTPAGGNVVRGNEISSYLKVLLDGGGIYTLGAQPGSFITGNVISGGRAGAGVGIYLDEGSAGIVVTGNAVLDSGQTPYLVKGDTNIVEDGVEIPGPDAVGLSPGYRHLLAL